MTAQIISIDTAALDAWRKRLDAARGEAIDGLLAFARECYAFQEDCKKPGHEKQGGTIYTNSMKEWYGIKHPASSQWATVGEHATKLLVATNNLPPSMETLYHLCDVPDNVIRDKVTKTTTQKDARKLKAEHGPKREPKPKKEKLFRIGWCDALVQAGLVSYGQVKGDGLSRLRKEIQKTLGFTPPKFFHDKAEATAFVDQVRPLRMEPPKREEFTEKQQKKVQRATDAEVAKVRREFTKAVAEEAQKRIKSLAEDYGKRIDEAEKTHTLYKDLATGLPMFMTKDEYRLVLGCLHTDSRPTPERLNQAFNIMKRVGRVFD